MADYAAFISDYSLNFIHYNSHCRICHASYQNSVIWKHHGNFLELKRVICLNNNSNPLSFSAACRCPFYDGIIVRHIWHKELIFFLQGFLPVINMCAVPVKMHEVGPLPAIKYRIRKGNVVMKQCMDVPPCVEHAKVLCTASGNPCNTFIKRKHMVSLAIPAPFQKQPQATQFLNKYRDKSNLTGALLKYIFLYIHRFFPAFLKLFYRQGYISRGFLPFPLMRPCECFCLREDVWKYYGIFFHVFNKFFLVIVIEQCQPVFQFIKQKIVFRLSG